MKARLVNFLMVMQQGLQLKTLPGPSLAFCQPWDTPVQQEAHHQLSACISPWLLQAHRRHLLPQLCLGILSKCGIFRKPNAIKAASVVMLSTISMSWPMTCHSFSTFQPSRIWQSSCITLNFLTSFAAHCHMKLHLTDQHNSYHMILHSTLEISTCPFCYSVTLNLTLLWYFRWLTSYMNANCRRCMTTSSATSAIYCLSCRQPLML